MWDSGDVFRSRIRGNYSDEEQAVLARTMGRGRLRALLARH